MHILESAYYINCIMPTQCRRLSMQPYFFLDINIANEHNFQEKL